MCRHWKKSPSRFLTSFFAEPSRWDIVYGRFPYREAPASPGQDFHPGLVLDVYREQSTRTPWVSVAFGTSRNVRDLRSGQFAVLPEHGAAFSKAGLTNPTKFTLARDRVAKLPYNDGWFAVPPQLRQWQAHPSIGLFDIKRYSLAIKAAGKSARIVGTLLDLETLALGAVPDIE